MELGKLEITPVESERVRQLKQQIRELSGSSRPAAAQPLVSENEIRAAFAATLTRRFEAMAAAKCDCYARELGGDHAAVCGSQAWRSVLRIVALTLADENGEE